MNKLTRKLMISVFTLAFALVTLGATTFAWFTLSSITTVEGIDVQIMAGNFMEISANGTDYKNLIEWDEITDQEVTTVNPRMNALTTSNGFDFLEMNYDTNEVEEASGGFVKFNLWVRAQKKGARVYLDKGTTTKSEPKAWVSDAEFGYRGDTVEVNEEILVYAADALRMSFVSFKEAHATPKAELQNYENVNIFELDPVGRDGEDLNQRLDDAIKTDGMLNYWYSKFSSNLEEAANNATLPTVLTNANLGADEEGEPNNTLAVLSHQADLDEEYFYGYLTIYLWIEGWDPDAFDAILQGKISVNLQFALAEPEPEPET